MTRPRARRTSASAVLLALALTVSACAADAPSPAGGQAGGITVNPDTPFDPLDGPAPDPDQPPDPQPAEQQPPPAPEPPQPQPQDEQPPPARDWIEIGDRDRARFDEVAVGDAVTRSFAVRVTSDDPTATVDAAVTGDAAFTAGEAECGPPAGDRRECRVDVTFAPRRPGPKSGTLLVTLDGAEPAGLALQGRAAAAPAPSPEPTPSPSA
jgi:hypothetical protein